MPLPGLLDEDHRRDHLQPDDSTTLADLSADCSDGWTKNTTPPSSGILFRELLRLQHHSPTWLGGDGTAQRRLDPSPKIAGDAGLYARDWSYLERFFWCRLASPRHTGVTWREQQISNSYIKLQGRSDSIVWIRSDSHPHFRWDSQFPLPSIVREEGYILLVLSDEHFPICLLSHNREPADGNDAEEHDLRHVGSVDVAVKEFSLILHIWRFARGGLRVLCMAQTMRLKPHCQKPFGDG